MELAKRNKDNLRSGFSLVELLVAMAITGVVMTAVFKIYTTQQDSYVLQEQVAEMQQNGRTAKYVMAREIRMAGYDPTGSNEFGLVSAGGNSIRFSMDIKVENGEPDPTGEVITYSVSSGNLERNDGSGNQIAVENIEAIGFGYAYDEDNDGGVETCGSDMKWAIDSDGDNLLDLNLDTDGDGDIDAQDGPGTGSNGLIGGQALVGFDGVAIPNVALNRIRAVRIWMLARSARQDGKFEDPTTYVIGRQVITPKTDGDPDNDHRRMRLVETTVRCRNL